METKVIFFVDTKEEKKGLEVKSKFLLFIQTTFIFIHYIQNWRKSASKYVFYKTLGTVERSWRWHQKSKNLGNPCVS